MTAEENNSGDRCKVMAEMACFDLGFVFIEHVHTELLAKAASVFVKYGVTAILWLLNHMGKVAKIMTFSL